MLSPVDLPRPVAPPASPRVADLFGHWPADAAIPDLDGFRGRALHATGLVGRLDGRLDRVADQQSLDASGAWHDLAPILLARYATDGPEILAEVVGDWALVLFDYARGLLVLARDGVGPRPLYVHRGPAGISVASRLDDLLADPRIDDRPDPEWLLGFLCGTPPIDRTPYRAIRAVEPGTARLLGPDHDRTLRLWWPSGEARHELDDRAAERGYRDRFVRAVRRRLVDPGAIGVDFSGGVDSTSIAAVASRLLRDDAIPTRELFPLSVVYRDSPSADESRYIIEAERLLGLHATRIVQEDHPIFAADEPFHDVPNLLYAVERRERHVAALLRAHDATTLLRGFGGDQVLWSENIFPFELADALRRGRLGTWARGLGPASRALGQPVPVVAAASLYPFLPTPVRRRFGLEKVALPPFLRPDAIRRYDLADRQFWETALGEHPPTLPSARQRRWQALDALAVVATGADRPPGGPVFSYPFLDRDLIDFCLGLPYEQFVRGTETRSIHRRALRGLVPPEILDRRSKTTMTEAMLRAYRAEGGRLAALLSDSRLADLGLIDPRPAHEALQRARFGINVTAAGLPRVFAAEAWLRRREAGRS